MQIGDELRKLLPAESIKDKLIDRVSFASDAGFYYLIPQAIVQPKNIDETKLLFSFSKNHAVPLVFRTGGTSLSGQAITDGILVDLSKNWSNIKVEKQGEIIRVQPGVIGLMANAHLKKYNRKIGPDPSSINAAMMGGIISNNASGMCCGVNLNSYHTTKFIKFILPDGNLYNTENPGDYQIFEERNSLLFKTIVELKAEIESNKELFDKIRKKYKNKNTVGYSLNAFIDFQHPLDIFAHLLIGGEGTLAFIAEAVMQTVPDYPFKSTGLLYFEDIYSACQAILPLTSSGALMVELMDRASLRSVENLDGMPNEVKTLSNNASALLVEFQENTEADLNDKVEAFLKVSKNLSLIKPPVFTKDIKEQAFFWKVRKGLFPAVGAVRASGTTVILEDVAFPVENLGDAIIDIQQLFVKHNYANGIIFGHAKDGNIHFVVTQTFNSSNEVARYEAFMSDIVTLVVSKYKGSLKAEHGTGRNMAPFVETEWGTEAYQIMKRLKAAADPLNLLNPGVIINSDKKAHLKNLKKLPTVEIEVDKCIECGFCEPKCPSKDFTSSPRRRIVTRRVLENFKTQGDTANYNLLLEQFQFDGLDTCAVDGLCATNCPVDINTGDLVKRLRIEKNTGTFANFLAKIIANNFAATQFLVRTALNSGFLINNVLGKNAMFNITSFVKKSFPSFPLWTSVISKPPILNFQKPKVEDNKISQIVYFPSCITRMMGTYEGKNKNLIETFFSVCQKSDIGVKVIENVNKSCCGQIFSSKGYKDAYIITANKIVEDLWISTNEGEHPVVIDVSSCAYTLHQLKEVITAENKKKYEKLLILDSIDFIHDYVLPVTKPIQLKKDIVLHPVCSLQKLKTEEKFVNIAQAFAQNVIVPLNAGCCGMAGDRGFLVPQLTESATLLEANEVKTQTAEAYYSSTKTCEMAMTEAVKQNYESILYLIDEGLV
jgi:D-lactate dehydrogenase